MESYDSLVKALRCCAENYGCPIECLRYAPADEGVGACVSRLERDAAAAIEDLQSEVERLKAENPIVETVLVDKMRQQMEETVCHCNVKENAELIAKILDDDVDGKVFELPKRGEWTEVEDFDGDTHYQCSVCGEEWYFIDGTPADNNANYCPRCGAKMEVQDADT